MAIVLCLTLMFFRSALVWKFINQAAAYLYQGIIHRLNLHYLQDQEGCGKGALLFRIGREACPIFSGLTILSRLKFLDLACCLFKFIFLGSYLAENLYFWINLAYNKQELNEKILNGRFSRPCCLPYRNVEHWKLSNLYFCVSFP